MDTAINYVLSLVQGPATKAIGYVLNVGANLRSLKKGVTKLKLTKGDIKVKIEDEATDEARVTARVSHWLEEVGAIEAMEVEIETDYNQRIKLIGGCLLNCWSGYRISRTAQKKTREAEVLDEEGTTFNGVTERVVPAVEWRPPMPEVPAFEPYMKQVSNYIRNNNSGVVGIWGMGGVGKTFLLDKIQTNQFVAGDGYHFVIRVTISSNPDLQEIQELILKRLNLRFDERDTTESRAFKILRFLQDKSFMLLLDELWREIDLQSLGIPRFSTNVESYLKQHIVFASPSQGVCMKMGASLKFQVTCLEWNAAWQLFLENLREVAEIINSNRLMQSYAMKVAKKCGGLPLALKTVAQAMSSKTTLREWKDALRMLDQLHLPEMWGKADDPFPLLKFSYDILPDNRMRQCFISCALWPEGWPLTNDDLILCWMGLGLLDELNGFHEAYDKGHTIIEEFKQLCLLEPPVRRDVWGDRYLKMHNVIRALALWIASDCGENEKKWLVRAGVELAHAPEIEKWGVAEKISLLSNDIQELPQHPQCPNLTTIILRHNPKLRIPNEFVKNMPNLRYLDAAFISIMVLPSEICRLTLLRYLDLSWTNIKSLPKELQLISGLVYLILENTRDLVTIPDGLIRSLTKLKLLNLLGSSCLKDSAICSMIVMELEKSRVHITLAATVFSQGDLDTISNSLNVTLWKVSVEFINTDVELIGTDAELIDTGARDFLDLCQLLINGKTRSCLQELKILRCYKISKLFMFDRNPDGENALENLEVLELVELFQLQMIMWKGLRPSELFCNLRTVRIQYCGCLTEISWIQGLQQLEDLSVAHCWQMKEVIAEGWWLESEINGEECVTAFPNLKSLSLDLPNLEAFYSRTLGFPCLEGLMLNCPKLKKLPFSSQITSNTFLNIAIFGSNDWWDGLLWEDDGLKSFFKQYFSPTDKGRKKRVL